MGFVLDSSVALAWLLPDEAGDATDVLANRLEQERARCSRGLAVGDWERTPDGTAACADQQ